MNIKKAVIPLGGLSTRFLPASKSVPKEMFPVVDKPILQYLVEELANAGIKEILFLIGRNRESVLNHFDKMPELNHILEESNKYDLLEKANIPCSLAKITFKRIYEPNGVADALLQAKDFVGNQPFILAFGDEMFYNNSISATKQIIREYNRTNKNVIACYEVDKNDVCNYGIMQIKNKDNTLFVESMVEKPKIEDAPSNLCAIGKYVLTKNIFACIEAVKHNFNKETNFVESLTMLAQQNELVACSVKGERFDTGSKLGYLIANVYYGLIDNDIKNKFKQEILKILK